MNPIDMQDLINRLRHDTTLDPEVLIAVYDLVYLEKVATFLESLHHSSNVQWWAISADDGIAMDGDQQTIEEFCGKYPRYRPERVEHLGWYVSESVRGTSPWTEDESDYDESKIEGSATPDGRPNG